jgi:hypothetical protein
MEDPVAWSWYVPGIKLCVSVVPLLGATVLLFGSIIVQSPGSSCGLCNKHSDTEAGSLPRTVVF